MPAKGADGSERRNSRRFRIQGEGFRVFRGFRLPVVIQGRRGS